MNDPTLFETPSRPVSMNVPVGEWRRTDPVSSIEAAQRISGRTERLVMQTSACFPDGLTDDELAARLPALYGPTVKSARSRCSRQGLLVDSGVTRPSVRGVAQIVWKLESRA